MVTTWFAAQNSLAVVTPNDASCDWILCDSATRGALENPAYQMVDGINLKFSLARKDIKGDEVIFVAGFLETLTYLKYLDLSLSWSHIDIQAMRVILIVLGKLTNLTDLELSLSWGSMEINGAEVLKEASLHRDQLKQLKEF